MPGFVPLSAETRDAKPFLIRKHQALLNGTNKVIKMKNRFVGALVVAGCGLYFLLTSVLLIRHGGISLESGLFAKISLVLEFLLVLFIGIATWLGRVPLVVGLLLASTLTVDTLVSITHCSILLYINVVLNSFLVLYALFLLRRRVRDSDSNPN
jgi:hypothetical protein